VIEFDPDHPTRSRVRVEIDAASVDTREPHRDDHLRSPEFFDVASHPAITFETTTVERHTLDDYEIVGNLTIRGIPRTVLLAVKRSDVIVDHLGQRRVAFAVSGTLSRKDFGLTWIAAELEAVHLPENRQVPGFAPTK
jgi:polyisoprenoid-binding protein YceI